MSRDNQSGPVRHKWQLGTHIIDAIYNNMSDKVGRFLRDDQSLSNIYHSGSHMRPLHVASGNNFAGIMELLIEAGADVNASDLSEKMALHMVSERGDVKSVQVLLDHQADIMARDKDGATPFDIAERYNNRVVMECIERHYAKKYRGVASGGASYTGDSPSSEKSGGWVTSLSLNKSCEDRDSDDAAG